MKRMIIQSLIDKIAKLFTSLWTDNSGNVEIGKDLHVDGNLNVSGDTTLESHAMTLESNVTGSLFITFLGNYNAVVAGSLHTEEAIANQAKVGEISVPTDIYNSNKNFILISVEGSMHTTFVGTKDSDNANKYIIKANNDLSGNQFNDIVGFHFNL
jgi:hypothetical protein